MEKAKGSVAVAGGVKVYTSHYLLLLLTYTKQLWEEEFKPLFVKQLDAFEMSSRLSHVLTVLDGFGRFNENLVSIGTR